MADHPEPEVGEKPLTVLVYGGRGRVGSVLVDALKAAGCAVVLGRSRLHDGADLEEELEAVRPDRILCAAGRTHGDPSKGERGNIDFLEESVSGRRGQVLNLRDNVFAPLQLAMAGQNAGVHVTYIGTGCIYDHGDAHDDDFSAFSEDDAPNFSGSAYSAAKAVTDQLFRNQMHETVLNLRIRMPIFATPNGGDLLTKLASFQRIIEVPNSVTVLPQVIPAMVALLVAGVTGTFNAVTPGAATHVQLRNLYASAGLATTDFEVISVAEQYSTCDVVAHRCNCILDSSLFWSTVASCGHPLPFDLAQAQDPESAANILMSTVRNVLDDHEAALEGADFATFAASQFGIRRAHSPSESE